MVKGKRFWNSLAIRKGATGAFVLLFVLLACGNSANAQMRSRRLAITSVKPRLMTLKRTTQVPKTSNSAKPPAEKPFLYNVSRQQIQQLKTSRISPGVTGGTSVFDRSQKTTVTKKRLFKTMAPVSGQGFGGISQGDASTDYYPPDPILAASSNEIVQTVNDAFEVTDTTGQVIYYESLYDLFSYADSAGEIFDPKVVYDPQNGRFILLCLYANDFDETSQYLLAVSEDSTDPGGLWWTYTFDATSDGTNPSPYMADFPGLGFDSTSIYMTSNQYDFATNSFQYAKLVVVDKASVYSGNYPGSTNEFYNMTNNDGSVVFTLKPASIIGSSSNEYLLNTESDGGDYITAWEISYASGTPSLTRAATVTIGNYSVPPDAQQAGSTSLIATGDCRTQEVVWKDNELYTAFTESYNWGSGPVAAVRLLKINTNTWAADRNVNFGADGINYFYPAVTPNNLDQTFLVFNSSSSSEDVDIRAAAEVWSDSSSVYIDGGFSNYEDPRWGDYSGISLSPTGTVWCTAEEAFGAYSWGTAIASLTKALGPTFTYMDLSDTVADFIGVKVGTSTTLRFAISNPVSSSGILSGTATVENSRFTILQGGTFSLSPGKEDDVVIQYNAANSGFMDDTLIVTNNSSSYSSPVKIPIVAYGITASSKPKRILFDLADDYYGTSDSLYFASFIRLLRAQGNTVVLDDGTFDLRGFDYFVSVTPYQDYTSSQVSTLQSFVKGGGGLIVLPYAYYGPGSQFQNDLLSAPGWTTGISITNEIVEDTTEDIDSTSTWVKLFHLPHPNDPVVAGIDTLGGFDALNLSVSAPADSLVVTSPNASSYFMKLQPVNGRYPRQNEQSLSAKGDEQILGAANSGPLPLVAKINVGSGQIIVFGSEEMFTESDYYPAYGGYPPYYFQGIRYDKNRVLGLNSFGTQTGPAVVTITSVQDVPNDAGEQVRVTWKTGFADGPSPITSFAVWRFDSSWTFLSKVPVDGDSIYSVIVPTLADSGVGGMSFAKYRVTVYTSNDLDIFTSSADSGYSVDNLVPHTPTNLMAHSVDSGFVALSWSAITDKDLQYYQIYRSSNSGFVADSSTLIGATIDTVYTDRTVQIGSQYYYRIGAVDFSGNRSLASPSAGLVVTSVKGKSSVPTVFSLAQNYPNPFNPTTVISYQLPVNSLVTLRVYDVLGRLVTTLVNVRQKAGNYSVTFDAGRFPSGVYLYRITANANNGKSFVDTKKLMLVK